MFGLQIRYLSFFFGLISVLSFLNILYSYYLNLYLNLDTYYFSLVLSLLISILFYKIKLPHNKPNIYNTFTLLTVNGNSLYERSVEEGISIGQGVHGKVKNNQNTKNIKYL